MQISLVGRHSPLSLNNKVRLYKQVLRPILTYAAQIWGLVAKTHRNKIQILQNKILRIMTNAPWYVWNEVIHNDLKIEMIETYISKLPRKFYLNLKENIPTIEDQVEYARSDSKYKYPYATTKWFLPLKPP